MPRVPSYDNFQATPAVSDARVANTISEDQTTRGARQLEQFGGAVQRAGATEGDIALDIQQQANQLRIADSSNKVRQAILDATYDPQNGYLTLKGDQALNRPGGQALPEEYGAKVQQSISNIAGTLGNEYQRRMFGLQANELLTNFKGDVERHMLSEFKDYHMSVAKGAAQLSAQEAELNWNNPQKIDQAINGVEDPQSGQKTGGIKQSIYQQALLTGASANEATALMNTAESAVHAKVIESALTNSNITYASQYFGKYKSNMQADDILKVQGQINHQMDAHTALSAVQQSTQKFTSGFQPNDMDRLMGVVVGQESGGKQFDAQGKPLTSKAGAVGIAQVMPGTAPEAAKLAGLEWDENKYKTDPVYNKALGQAYLTKQLQTFGEVDKALAAYNAGPQTLKDAMASAEKDGAPDKWLEYMPLETQKYVKDGVSRYGTGATTPPVPTESEFVNDALSRLGENPRIEAVSATREAAEKQYELLIKSRKEQGEQALGQAQKELIANGGNFNGLAPKTVSDLARYDPGKYDDALKFAKSISKGENVTNMEAYATAVTYPQELAKMSDPIFLQFLKTNFSVADQEKIAKVRANAINEGADTSPQSINEKAFKNALNPKLLDIGINPLPKRDDKSGMSQIGAIQKFIRDDLLEQQAATGHKFTPKEVEDHIDKLFATSTEISHWYGDSAKQLFQMKIGDVPSNMREAIKRQFAARGNTNPTDNDILRFYWKYKYGGTQQSAK